METPGDQVKILGCRVMGNMFTLSWKSLQEQTSTADAKAVPQCPSSGLELGVKTTWQLCTSWGVNFFPQPIPWMVPRPSRKTAEMLGMEGLPAILFGSEQNARGRRCLGRLTRDPIVSLILTMDAMDIACF